VGATLRIARAVSDGVAQALEGTLAQHGRLVVLAEAAAGALRKLGLKERWADF
jgi:hypothetical protein